MRHAHVSAFQYLKYKSRETSRISQRCTKRTPQHVTISLPRDLISYSGSLCWCIRSSNKKKIPDPRNKQIVSSIIPGKLAFSWLSVGLQLAFSWPSVGFQLAFSWPSVGLQLAFSWLSVGFQLAFSWLSVGFQLLAGGWLAGWRLAGWMAGGINLVDILGPCFEPKCRGGALSPCRGRGLG